MSDECRCYDDPEKWRRVAREAPMTKPLSELLEEWEECGGDPRLADEMASRLRKLDEALAGKRYGVMLINVAELRRILDGEEPMSPKLDSDWKPSDDRDARIEELEEEVERLRVVADAAVGSNKIQGDRIEAALALLESSDPPVYGLVVKALKGE